MSSYYEKILATGEVKCIDEEIPFEIPTSWSWARLGNLIDIKGGKRLPAGYKLTDNKTDHIYIRVSDMQDGTIVSKDLKYITDDVYNQIQNYTIGKDDLYLTIVGSTIGKAGLVPKMFDNMNLTENAVKLTNIPINKYFLLYYVRSGYAQSQFRDNTKQVGQPKLAIFRIANTLVPIPPFAEQTKIVSKIEYTLHLVNHFSNLQEQLHDIDTDIYRDLKKSILQEAIQGKLVPQIAEEGTAKELLELIKAEKQKLVKEGKLKKSALNDSGIFRGDDNKYYTINKKERISVDDEIPFDIPNTWEWCRLGILFSHSTGKALNASNLKGQLMTYITTSNLYWDRFELDNLKQMRFTDEEIEKCTATFGDLLVCEGGDIGRAAIWNYQYDIRIQNHIHKLRAYKQLCTKFFFWVFYFYKATGRIGGKGIGIQGLSSKALDNILIPLPPLKEQQRIVAQIEKLFEQLH